MISRRLSHCSRAQPVVRFLRRANPVKLRFVHRPVGVKFLPRSGADGSVPLMPPRQKLAQRARAAFCHPTA